MLEEIPNSISKMAIIDANNSKEFFFSIEDLLKDLDDDEDTDC
jgi:hypothetical protein